MRAESACFDYWYVSYLHGRTQHSERFITWFPILPDYGTVLPPEVKCFSEWLRRAGYYCTNNAKTDYQFEAPLSAWDESDQDAHWRKRPEGAPFFAVINFLTTHE